MWGELYDVAAPAPWRSGYAAACKAVYTGSIPVGASHSRTAEYRCRSTFAVARGTIGDVEVTATATIWVLFSCFLIFPHLGFPALMHRTAATLLTAELVALMMWSYGSEGCVERPCAAGAELGRTAAAIDVPLLAVALVAVAMIRGMRLNRRRQRVTR